MLLFSLKAWSSLGPQTPLTLSQLTRWPKGTAVFYLNQKKVYIAAQLEDIKGNKLIWQWPHNCVRVRRLDPLLPPVKWENCRPWGKDFHTGSAEVLDYHSPWPLKRGKRWSYKLKVKDEIKSFNVLKSKANKFVLNPPQESRQEFTVKCQSYGNDKLVNHKEVKWLQRVKCWLGKEDAVTTLFDVAEGHLYYQRRTHKAQDGSLTTEHLWFYKAKTP